MAVEYQPVYILASGMLLQQRKLSVIANNIANSDTPSFKKDLLLASLWQAPNGQQTNTTDPQAPENNFLYPTVERIFTDLSQGALKETKTPLM